MSTTKEPAIDVHSLESLEAYIDALESGGDEALAKLAGKTDDDSVRRRLSILVTQRRLTEAANEARTYEPSDSWAQLGVFALAATGAIDEATKLLGWARSRPERHVRNQATVGYAEGVMLWALRGRIDNERIVPGSLSETEKQYLQHSAATLEDSFRQISASGNVSTELESQVLQRYFDIAYLFQQREILSQIVALLLTRSPVPIKVGEAVLQGLVAPVDGLVGRLWSEYPGSFRAKFLALLVESRVDGRASEASRLAHEVIQLASTQDEKEDICNLIYELSQGAGPERIAEAIEISENLLGSEAPLVQLFAADKYLQMGDSKSALPILERVRDEKDARWLRLAANAAIKQDRPVEALEWYQKLARLVPSPEVFNAIAGIARKINQVSIEQVALEKSVALAPSESPVWRRLAQMCMERADYFGAANYLEQLKQIQPDAVDVVLNLAVCYAIDGKIAKALSVLSDAKERGLDSLPTLLMHANILRSDARVKEAFQLLEGVKTSYWDNPEFLMGYMTMAYASEEETSANEAVLKLRQLHEQGLVSEDKLRLVPMDELIQVISESRKRSEQIKQLVIEGKFPWITAASMSREVPYWSWTLRTQPLDWLHDDPLNRSSHCIYATNSFRVFQENGQPPRLVEIGAPTKGTEVVADISALITLHSLNLIDKATEYFGKILVPTTYLQKAIDDTNRLFPHQRSQKSAAEGITASVDNGTITILETGSRSAAHAPTLPVVDEYLEEDRDRASIYRIQDLLDALHEGSILSDTEFAQAKGVAHKPAKSDPGERLTLRTAVRVSLLTLEVLTQIGLLPRLTREFSVHVSREDFEEVKGKVRSFAALEITRAKHVDLWKTLRQSNRISFVPASQHLKPTNEEDDFREAALSSYLVAKDHNIPLLVDDRVCQSILLNERPKARVAAFGTDRLLMAMADAEFISREDAANALLQLMEWRYRFILPPPDILKVLADRFRSHPPGLPLRKAARYVHDCMRDLGLFGGLEPSQPPVSIAVRLYTSWVQVIAELVIAQWSDANVPDASAEEFTNWAATQMMPSPPRILDDQLQANAALLTARAAIGMALVKGSTSPNFERVNRGLRALATAIGIDEQEYLRIVAGVINAS